MTQTRGWLERRRTGLVAREGLAVAFVAVGSLALALALGLWLGRIGAYRRLPELVLLGWAMGGAAVAVGLVLAVRRGRRLSATVVASELEAHAGLRSGSVGGLALPASGSAALAALADERAASWLRSNGDSALAGARRVRGRAVRRGAVAAAAGIGLFWAAGPGSGGAFWHPLDAIAEAHGPVLITVSRDTVRRGESVAVTVAAAGRRAAVLHTRATGEPWEARALALDSGGRATVALGPLESARFVHATAGRRHSDTLLVSVALPAFLSDLTLLARYPGYLDRPDEPLVPGAEPVLLPVGTRVLTRGRVTVPVDSIAWVAAGRVVPLSSSGTAFDGALVVTQSGDWSLRVAAVGGAPLESEAPRLVVIAVPDSAPTVAVPVPGADTTAPTSLRQPLVIDVRDDYRVTGVEVSSRRVSRLGIAGEPVTESIPLPALGVERAVLQWLLDLNERGFLPGDTAFFKVRVVDNAPAPQVTESREFALRLPALSEMREAARAQARALAAAADSLSRRQRELARETEELATERERHPSGSAGFRQGNDQLGFRSAERSGEVSNEQRAIMDRAQELRDRLRELSDAAWQAGLTDPEWHQQLRDLQDLLERAITPELEEALRELQEAMQRLDAPGVREALERLAEAQQELRRELERSQTLFERAAVEGEMTTLAEDAQDLAQRQEEWNRAAERAVDSALADRERQLAEAADSLAERLAEMERAAAEQGADPQPMDASQRARDASGQMQQAAQAARQGQQRQAQQSGDQASSQLDPIAENLREQRDQMREAWREEVMQAMDHALVETAQLARQQEEVQERLARGETAADLRSAQAAVRDGVDRVVERLQNAAGKNALVSPRLGTALGVAKVKMTAALQQLQQANPNTASAAQEAGEALDGLNAVAHQLLRSQSDVAGAASGSGLQEAIERMAQLAQQQNSMAGQATGLLPMMPMGGDMLMQELQALAQQQRQLAQELERLRAETDQTGAGEMADEARELAERLESGVLDREMVERQERLYRRLLDAGRTLRGNEEDDEKERSSRTGRADNVLVPTDRPAPDAGPRYPYPSWQALQRLSPEERRLILDYFRRLNDARRARTPRPDR